MSVATNLVYIIFAFFANAVAIASHKKKPKMSTPSILKINVYPIRGWLILPKRKEVCAGTSTIRDEGAREQADVVGQRR